MEKIMQHIFTKNNVHMFFLSPYASVEVESDILYVGNSNCAEEAYVLDNHDNWAFDMIQKLRVGVTEEEFKKMISENTGEDAEEWLAFFIQGGIIE